MGRFIKRLVAGTAVATVVLAGGAFAQSSTLDNFERGTDQNMFGGYWYFYDDNAEVTTVADLAGPNAEGNSVVHSARREGTRLLFDPAVSLETGANVQLGQNAAKLEFKFGRTFRTGYDNRSTESARNPVLPTCPSSNSSFGCYDFEQFVGIGTTLSPHENRAISLAGATRVTFWARANRAMSIRFYLEQTNIPKEGAFWGKIIPITTGWDEYTVELNETDMSQPPWTSAAEQNWVTPFDINNIARVAWQVQSGAGGGGWVSPMGAVDSLGAGNLTVLLDDIEFHGFRFVPENMCESCIVSALPAGSEQFSNFQAPSEHSPYGDARNELPGGLWTYWYAYDDNGALDNQGNPGTSEILTGVAVGEFGEQIIVQEGDDLFVGITFELGRQLSIDDPNVGVVSMDPFVGIGTNLYDDLMNDPEFFDATAEGVHGLYFEYLTNAPVLTFELHDRYDVGSPAQRPETAVWYINLPGETGAEWRRARVPFSVLTTRTEWDGVREWTLANPAIAAKQLNALAKFQFKIQGDQGQMGGLQIRNAYFLDAAGSPVRHRDSGARAAGLRANYNRGVVAVNWNAASTVASGRISLVNTRGRVISSAPIANVSGNRITANLGSGNIPTGMYFVRIDARDMNGKRVTQQIPLSIVK